MTTSGHYAFRPPPGWPPVPDGWTPPEGWQPDPSWGPPPAEWDFWSWVEAPPAPAPWSAPPPPPPGAAVVAPTASPVAPEPAPTTAAPPTAAPAAAAAHAVAPAHSAQAEAAQAGAPAAPVPVLPAGTAPTFLPAAPVGGASGTSGAAAWVGRHKVASAAAALLLVVGLNGALGGGDEPEAVTLAAAPAQPAAAAPAGATAAQKAAAQKAAAQKAAAQKAAADKAAAAKKAAAQKAAAQKAAAAQPPLAASAKAMIALLEGNALKAKSTYEDKRVSVKGFVGSIDASGDYFALDPEKDALVFTGIQVRTSDRFRDQIAGFSKGQAVTVTGKITDVGEILGYQLKAESIG